MHPYILRIRKRGSVSRPVRNGTLHCLFERKQAREPAHRNITRCIVSASGCGHIGLRQWFTYNVPHGEKEEEENTLVYSS